METALCVPVLKLPSLLTNTGPFQPLSTSSWTAGCAQLSLHLLELQAGFWVEPASPDHALHVRLDRLGEVGKQRLDGREHEAMLPAATVFLPAGTVTGWRVSVSFRRLIIRLQPAFLLELLPPDAQWPEQLAMRAPAHDPVLDHYAGLVLHEANTGAVPDPSFLEAFARLIGTHILRRYVLSEGLAAAPPGLSPQQRARLDAYIRATLPEPIVIEALAEACGLSHYQLLRLIKRSTGDTPQHYVLTQRIELARKMLRESELPLTEIALALGFSSQSHFSNTFKAFTQTTPKAYRERSDLI